MPSASSINPARFTVRRRPRELRPRSLLVHVSLLLLAALGLAGTMGFLLWAALGRPGLPPASPLDSKDRLEVVKLILAIVGGVGAVVALTIAYRRQRRGENAEHDQYIKLFTDRLGMAAEQLGHESPATRMAGVYAMSRLADDVDDEDTDGRQQCINVLCSYLRLPYEPERGLPGYREGEHVVRQ